MPGLRGKIAQSTFSCLAVVLGVAWLVLEYQLRQTVRLPTVDGALAMAVALAATLTTLALRPRVSMQGELRLAREIAWLSVAVLFLPLAAMAILYLLASFLSVALVGFLWAGWGAGVAVVFAVQILILGLTVFGGLAAVGGLLEKSGGLLLPGAAMLIAGLVLAAIAAHLRSTTIGASMDFSMVNAMVNVRDNIPTWSFLLTYGRGAALKIDHVRAASLAVSGAIGVAAGLVSGGFARYLRQKCMSIVTLRPYLPLGGAPVPDNSIFLTDLQAATAGFILLVAWLFVAAFAVN